jgi:SAM-dependent methyltransferase
MNRSKEILKTVDKYYTSKVNTLGATSEGVDWNGPDSQYLRFKILSEVIAENKVSILDYGCGYGEYINYLNSQDLEYAYTGYDISKAMIKQAKEKFPGKEYIFTSHPEELKQYDYAIASGIFNVKNEINDNEWQDFILSELKKLDMLSQKGFSFNALTTYSDKEFMKEYLHYANPLLLFDHCKKHFSRNVALLHDYGLYEFTIIVRK